MTTFCCDMGFLEELKKHWGTRLIKIEDDYYLAGYAPRPDQAEPKHLPNGIPIRHMLYMPDEHHHHDPSPFHQYLKRHARFYPDQEFAHMLGLEDDPWGLD